MKLGKRELCPLHKSRTCCGRDSVIAGFRRQYATLGPGVSKIPDEHHPRGYRVRRSRAAMKKLLAKKIIEQEGICGICGNVMLDYRDIVPDHIDPRCSGGAWRDDHDENIQAAHSNCNQEKGSRRTVGKSALPPEE